MSRDHPFPPTTAVAERFDGDDRASDGSLEPLLDTEAVARLLSVKPSWIYEAVRSRRIPHVKIGRHIRFLRSDLEAWIVHQRQ